MENSTSKPKTSLRWRILRWCAIAFAGLVTLIALVWAEENWRGKRAWDNYKREHEAKGEKFDLKAIIPPPVPDEQNFAMTPFLAPLFDFNPKRSEAGQSFWRDTNAVQKTRDFGNEIGWPKSVSSGSNNSRRLDLTAWSTAVDGKKEVPASGESLAARATAGKAILQKMKKYAPVLQELQEASRRPEYRFNIGYEDEDPNGILLPHLAVMKKLSLMYRLRASAELAAGQPDAAIEDIKMGIYLSGTLRSEPFLISGLVQIAMVNITLQPVWEGLADRRWSEPQLKELQEELKKIDMLRDYGVTMRGERAFNHTMMEYQRQKGRIDIYSDADEGSGPRLIVSQKNWSPSAMYYQNEVAIGRMYEKVILPPVDADKHRIYLDLSTNAQARLDKELKGGFIMYTILAKMLFPAIIGTEKKYAKVQVDVDEAITACALERYRLAHGEFPKTLEMLSPQFIEKTPPDVMTGEPLKYRRTEDGQFMLYSVGWNGTDDDGTIVLKKGTTPGIDITQGDWVWKYP